MPFLFVWRVRCIGDRLVRACRRDRRGCEQGEETREGGDFHPGRFVCHRRGWRRAGWQQDHTYAARWVHFLLSQQTNTAVTVFPHVLPWRQASPDSSKLMDGADGTHRWSTMDGMVWGERSKDDFNMLAQLQKARFTDCPLLIMSCIRQERLLGCQVCRVQKFASACDISWYCLQHWAGCSRPNVRAD